MKKATAITVMDIPLDRLEADIPKPFTPGVLAPIRKSIESIGLVERLIVCKNEGSDKYEVIQGKKRYSILLTMGVKTVPCVLAPRRDIYTPSYQVIAVSPAEREKMLKKAREKVSDDKIAAAIGISSLKPELDKKLADKLSSVVKHAFEQKLIPKAALQELANVTPKRQADILKELKQVGSYSLEMIKGKILLTPPKERVVKEKKNPWKKSEDNKGAITQHLQELKKQCSAIVGMLHTYVHDVTQQLIYIRGFLHDEETEQYVKKNYPDMYKKFREIMGRE